MKENEKAPLGTLMSQSIWVLWRREEEGSKVRKVPFAANGGSTGTNEKHRSTWVTYPEAIAAMQTQKADGIGFILPPGYCFVDIDHRAEDDPLVQDIWSCIDSYAERSVSGEGIHLYGKVDTAQLPVYEDGDGRLRLDRSFYAKNPNNGVEIYFGGLTNRFVVYTGDAINDKPLADCTQGILTVLHKHMRRPAQSDTGKKEFMGTNHSAGSVGEIVDALRQQKNGKKFSALFDRGDIGGYRSKSEADLALCALTAFRTGPNPDLIDAVFRCSALYSEKWDRTDYRNGTIDKAIAGCTGFYQPSAKQLNGSGGSVQIPKQKSSESESEEKIPPFIKFNQSNVPYVSCPLLAKYFREHFHYKLVRSGGKEGAAIYLYQDGRYELVDEQQFMGIIKQLLTDYDEQIVRMRDVREACQMLLTESRYADLEEFNSDESLINFTNGLLYVSGDELKLQPHSPETLSTIQIPCEWEGEEVPTPVFDRFMDRLTNGDKAVEELLLEFMGVCFSNVKGFRFKKALFLFGEGDTGKSIFKKLLERILGKGNFMAISLQELEGRFGKSALFGKRLAGSSDMSFLPIKELSNFKMLTGGDSVFADSKFKNPFEFTYGGMLCFCTNQLPVFGGDNGKWVYDRIMAVECINVIPAEEQDKKILDKLYAERVGIIYKAVRALQTVIANGYRFSEPESVMNVRKKYQLENSSVIGFLQSCLCETDGSGYSVTLSKIFDAYRTWHRENCDTPPKKFNEFRNELITYFGISPDELIKHTNVGSVLRNFTLKQEAMALIAS